MTLDLSQLAILLLAGIAGGLANSLAGGGTLIVFPALLAVGLPPVVANMTNAVALCPGYVGAIVAQWVDLKGQGRRVASLTVATAGGSLIGAWLLLHTSEKHFVALVPFLLLLACGLLAVQDPVRRLLARRAASRTAAGLAPRDGMAVAVAAVGVAAVYGGYFGPGVSVVFMAVLGLVLVETLTRLNALKSALGFILNLVAAVYFIGSGRIFWPAVGVVAFGAIAGGFAGGRLAGAIRPETLRRIIIGVGVTVALVLLWKN